MSGPFSIKEIIQQKINEADNLRGRFTNPVRLESGIAIRIRKDAECQYTVYLSKDGPKPPSEIQIQTFVDSWPRYAQINEMTASAVIIIRER